MKLIPNNINIPCLIEVAKKKGISLNEKLLVIFLDLISYSYSNPINLRFRHHINSNRLKKITNNYKRYIKFLESENIIEIDNKYLKNEYSKSYKFTPKYTTCLKMVDIMVEDDIINNSTSNVLTETPKWLSLQNFNFLKKWFNPLLKIDYSLALEIITEKKLLIEQLNNLEDSKNTKNYYDYYISTNRSAALLDASIFKIKSDTTSGRLHTNLTNMSKDIKYFLTYNNKTLVSLDLVNSQPLLSSILFIPSFWFDESLNVSSKRTFKKVFSNSSNLNLNICTINYFDEINKTQNEEHIDNYNNIINTLSKSFDKPDVIKYKALVQSGEFYDTFEKQVKELKNNEEITRDEIKSAIFLVLFSDNRYFAQKEAELKRIFKTNFPSVYNVFAAIKKRDNAILPCLLQRLESHIFLSVICNRIISENPRIPIFTIHDSILTTKGNEDFIKKMIEEEFEKLIGFIPKLHKEELLPEIGIERLNKFRDKIKNLE